MYNKFVILSLLILCIISCRPRKDFIITDEYVDRESGVDTSSDKKSAGPKLSDKDRKYFAGKLDVAEDEIANARLYNFIKNWEGAKYVPGGSSRKGIDNPRLAEILYKNVYNKKIAGTAAEIAMDKKLFLFKSTDKLREGDLVFFRMDNDELITHVGIYLKNNKFFATSQYGGTKILSIRKGIWNKGFVTAGRFQD